MISTRNRNEVTTNIGLSMPADVVVGFDHDISPVSDVVMPDNIRSSRLIALRDEQGSSTTGTLLKLGVVAAVGAYIVIRFGQGDSNPDLGGQNRTPSTIVGHQALNQVCVDTYFTQGSDVASKDHSIAGINIPDSSISAKVTGRPGILNCMKSNEASYRFTKADKTLVYTIPEVALTSHARINPTDKSTTYTEGRFFKVGELLVFKNQAVLLYNTITGGDAFGYDQKMDSDKQFVGSIAEMKLMQTAVEGCGPEAYKAFMRDDIIKANTDNINNLLKAIGESDVKVSVEPPPANAPPKIPSEFTPMLNKLASDSSIKIQPRPSGEHCTVTSSEAK